MAFQRTSFSHEGHAFQFLKGKKSPILTLAISGAGYHTDLPLFYYSCSWLASRVGPVLQATNSSIPTGTIRKVWKNTIEKYKAKRHVIICKSVGTVKAHALLKKMEAVRKKSKVIWLTPLLESEEVSFYEDIKKWEVPSLVVIGDRDMHYNKKRLKELNELEYCTVHIAKGATHSLEYKDKGEVLKSLQLLSDVVEACQKFVLE